jgi:hypothetical protein
MNPIQKLWAKYTALSKQARLALGISLIIGGIVGPYITSYLSDTLQLSEDHILKQYVVGVAEPPSVSF